MQNRVYSLEEAKLKIERYCAYQDRCHYEVETKLKSFGLLPVTIDQIMLELIQNKFLDEERFARSFASGKHKIKLWGKKKIELKMKEKRVSSSCIRLGLSEIDDEEYIENLHRLVDLKWESESKLKKKFDRRGKVATYLMNKGYESDLVWEALEKYPLD